MKIFFINTDRLNRYTRRCICLYVFHKSIPHETPIIVLNYYQFFSRRDICEYLLIHHYSVHRVTYLLF
jgi:hypothetical protein